MTDLPHRQRTWGFCLSCTRHPAALAFPLVFVHANIQCPIPDACFPSLSLIAFHSRQPHRDTIGLFSFSHVIYCLFSWRAISLSHHSILMQRSRGSESFCPDRSVHLKDKWEGKDDDEDVVDSVNTNRIVYIYPQQQAQLQRDTLKTVWLK